MAMDGKALGDAIAAVITDAQATPAMKQQIKALWEKIGGAIVSHIQQNAQVLPGILVSTPVGAGSTSGPGQIQ